MKSKILKYLNLRYLIIGVFTFLAFYGLACVIELKLYMYLSKSYLLLAFIIICYFTGYGWKNVLYDLTNFNNGAKNEK